MTQSEHRSILRPGDEFVVEAKSMAHGGHVIAHHAGRTLLVRHAIPGEQVRVRVTESGSKVTRVDAVEVLVAAPTRVAPPCRFSGPGGCGGCDFQHMSLPAQRAAKEDVLRSSLRRFGGLQDADLDRLDTRVHALPGHLDGLRWMTRVGWAEDASGMRGLHRHRSHDVVPVDHCLLAPIDIDSPPATRHAVAGESARAQRTVRHRNWRISGFWQIHPHLPEALVETVLGFGTPEPGEQWWDLYSGSGLFAAFLAERVGREGSVIAVETSASSVAAGREALHDLPQVRWHVADVSRWILEGDHVAPDGVVLDPPRAGAGEGVIAALTSAGIPRLLYVACDPVALARDLRVARANGYAMRSLAAFDAFPMTHHFETVAHLAPV
jgi:tRNA/tmRNA/rRNA uracil-C5-methylase (TrmA/RlmC/RlmD family)